MNSWKMQKSLKMKEIAKRSEIITILFINLHVYKKLKCLMND
jgi:nitrate reductase NapE component